jgi:hypothetical protein
MVKTKIDSLVIICLERLGIEHERLEMTGIERMSLRNTIEERRTQGERGAQVGVRDTKNLETGML